MATSFDQLHDIITTEGKKGGEPARIAKELQPKFAKARLTFDSNAGIYADLVQQLSQEFSADDVKAAADELKAFLTTRGFAEELKWVNSTLADVDAYRSGKVRETAKILRSVVGPRPWLVP